MLTCYHLQVQIGCQTDNLGEADVIRRACVVHERFPLDKEMVQVCNLWGGLIYIVAPPKSKVDGVEIVVQTSVQAPYFKSGKNVKLLFIVLYQCDIDAFKTAT